MKYFLIIIMMATFSFVACGNDMKKETTDKSDKNYIIIDTRTQMEYDASHIEGALLIPYDVIGSRIEEEVKDKNAHIALYCRSGRRSGIATNILKNMGYKNAENYGGMHQAKERLKNENIIE